MCRAVFSEDLTSVLGLFLYAGTLAGRYLKNEEYFLGDDNDSRSFAVKMLHFTCAYFLGMSRFQRDKS